MKKSTILLTLLATSVAGCASPGKKTAIGAATGAAGGALIGGIAGHGAKGAAIGAVAGGALGGAVGNRLDKQAQELKQVADTRRTDEGIVVNLKNDLLFDTGRAAVKPAALPQLQQVGGVLAKYPDDRIEIAGHTDSSGSDANNQTLSQQRAEAVKSLLLNQGVKPEQISTVGMGESQPVADNKSAAGRQKNRRVELHIQIPDGQKA